MFETYAGANKGSQTAANVAEDIGVGGGHGSAIVDALGFDFRGLARRGLEKGFAVARGEREDVRQILARLLMANASDPDFAADALTKAMAARQQNTRAIDPIVRSLLMGPTNTIQSR
jgi:hypothetical protein